MIKVKFGATGVTEFNVADFFLQSLINLVEFEISDDTIRLYADEKNYVELRGSFVDGHSRNPLDYVEELDGYKFVVDGKMTYQVTGLDLDGETLGSFTALQEHLDASSYRMTGNDAANKLSAGSGKDILDGGKGNDWLIGNGGKDVLIGGRGRDHFVFHKGDGKDQIKDFTASGKEADTIDLSDWGGKLRFRDLDISREGKHDVLIEIGKHDEILLHDVKLKDITSSDFDF